MQKQQQVDLKKQIKDNSLKLTGQRQIILNLLAENSDKHLSADDVHKLLMQEDSRIGIATVYRTLALLEKLKFISKIFLEDGCTRYQILNPKEKHEHHHMVCEQCGKVTDMQDDLLESLEKQLISQYGFRVTNHKVKIIGICKDCIGAPG